MPKVLLVPYSFYPDPVGGAEIYVAALARELVGIGIQVLIAATGTTAGSYVHNGLRVIRFTSGRETSDVSSNYGDGLECATAELLKIVESESVDIVHVHIITAAVSYKFIAACRSRGIPVVFTSHAAANGCARSTLLRWGTEICDAKYDRRKCAACLANSRGLPRPVAALVGWLPPVVGRVIGRMGLRGKIWTALRMPELVALQQATFLRLLQTVDQIVTVSAWQKKVLVLNGTPGESVFVSRQAVAQVTDGPHNLRSAGIGADDQPVRIAFFGRLVPIKGIDILLSAFGALDGEQIVLDVYGSPSNDAAPEYAESIRARVAASANVRIRPSVPADEILQVISRYDAVAMPSQICEAAPLVITEAFAVGVPVIGSRLGGIAEMVRDNVDGLLVDPFSVSAWVETFRRVACERGLLDRLRSGVIPPRTMKDVAMEMSAIYERLERRGNVTINDGSGVSA